MLLLYDDNQKQPFANVPRIRFSQKFRKIHKKTPASKSLFDKGHQHANLSKFSQRILRREFCEFCKIFWSTFLQKNNFRRLVLNQSVSFQLVVHNISGLSFSWPNVFSLRLITCLFKVFYVKEVFHIHTTNCIKLRVC